MSIFSFRVWSVRFYSLDKLQAKALHPNSALDFVNNRSTIRSNSGSSLVRQGTENVNSLFNWNSVGDAGSSEPTPDLLIL